MADMHPHRRAQLELEQARQAGLVTFSQRLPDELAAAAAIRDAAMRAAATGANREPAGARQVEPQANINPSRFTHDTADVERARRASTRQRRKHLHRQIEEAAGDYVLARQSIEELEAIHDDSRQARKDDVQRTARIAQERADRTERKIQARAKTKRERRLIQMSRVDSRRDRDRAWDAEQPQRAECLNGYDNATIGAARQPSEHDSQQPALREYNQAQLPAQALFGERQWLDPFVTRKQDGHDMQANHGSAEQRYAWSEQSSTRSCRSLRSMSTNLERIDVNDRPAGGSPIGNDDAMRMESDFVPLGWGDAQEREWKALRLPIRSDVADRLVSEHSTVFAPPEELDTRNINAKDAPMAACESTEQISQSARPMFGDGSKGFLDPGSTAYKMMARMGWAQGKGLGKDGVGVQDFIKVDLKRDRKGVREAQVIAPVCQEARETNAGHPAPAKGPDLHPPNHNLQQISGGIAVGYYQNLRWIRNRGALQVRPQCDVITAADEKTGHHKRINGGLETIDLTQDESELRKTGIGSSREVGIDLTQDSNHDDGRGDTNDCMIMDSTATWDKARVQRDLAIDGQPASNIEQLLTMLDNAPDGTFELQSGTAQSEQMGFVQHRIGTEGLQFYRSRT